MVKAIAGNVAQEEPESLTPTEPLSEADRNSFREAVRAFVRSGGTDTSAREQLLRLPGGEEALAKVMRIQAGQRLIAGRGMSSEEFIQEKHRELEQEFGELGS